MDNEVVLEQVEVSRCDSCAEMTQLYDVPHAQLNNNHIWHYCKRCSLAHAIELQSNDKIREVMAVNPALAQDPEFATQVRQQITMDLMNLGGLPTQHLENN